MCHTNYIPNIEVCHTNYIPNIEVYHTNYFPNIEVCHINYVVVVIEAMCGWTLSNGMHTRIVGMMSTGIPQATKPCRCTVAVQHCSNLSQCKQRPYWKVGRPGGYSDLDWLYSIFRVYIVKIQMLNSYIDSLEVKAFAVRLATTLESVKMLISTSTKTETANL